MIVVDTTVWIDFFRGRHTLGTEKLIEAINLGTIIVGDLVLVEILQGLRDNQQARRVEGILRRHPVEAMLDPASASRVAGNYRHLREIGITVRKTADLIIGTFCIDRGYTLLHNDRDFEPMRQHLGLKVVCP